MTPTAWLEALPHAPLLALGLVLVVGALLGGGAERLRIPWITGCVLAGILLGPSGGGLLGGPALAALGAVAQVAVAVIAFNIGCQLAVERLRAVGPSIAVLAAAQLIAPVLLVLAGETLLGLGLAAALILAAVSPMTAPTTTFSVIRRRQASGPFVDRALGILALNDAAAVLLFSVVSAAAVGLLAAGTAGGTLTAALAAALRNEAVSLLLGAALGLAWLGLRRLLSDGSPGWEARLLAALLGLLLAGIGAAIAFRLSHLLVPLGTGIAIANGLDAAGRERVKGLIHAVEDPLFIVFFVLAGAHLPLAEAGHAALLLAALAYVAGRFIGKFGAVFLTASALGMDPPTRRWLGLCFPSQGGLAMGAVIALKSSAAVQALPAEAAAQVDMAISVILIAVLVSQLLGPALIDLAIRRGAAAQPSGAKTQPSG